MLAEYSRTHQACACIRGKHSLLGWNATNLSLATGQRQNNVCSSQAALYQGLPECSNISTMATMMQTAIVVHNSCKTRLMCKKFVHHAWFINCPLSAMTRWPGPDQASTGTYMRYCWSWSSLRSIWYCSPDFKTSYAPNFFITWSSADVKPNGESTWVQCINVVDPRQ